MSEPVDVILLRSADDPDPYVQAFQEIGLRAGCQSVLRFVFPYDEALRDRLAERDRYGGLVATSPRAARALRSVLDDMETVDKKWAGVPVYVVGQKTAGEFRALGFDVRGAHTGNAAALASWIADAHEEGPLLFLSGNRRRDTLPEGLTEAGVPFDEQVVYETKIRSDVSLPAAASNAWLVFFSPSGVEAVRRSEVTTDEYRCAAIGPTTAGILRDMDVRVAAVADTPSPEGVVTAITSAQGGGT